MTSRITNKLGALTLSALVTAATLTGVATTTARAQSSNDALLNALVRKGILTQQDAKDLSAEVAKQNQASVLQSIAGSKNDTAFVISGRIQAQYANIITTDADGKSDALTNNRLSRAFLRRVYLGVKANLGTNWSANVNYDFADGTFDKAFIEWAGKIYDAPFSFDIGLRKVNFAYEEYTSSANLKAIERSGLTRYFVEDANGRRLGAGSYRIGIFADYNPAAFAGKAEGFFAGAAITNADRQSNANLATNLAAVSTQDNTVSNQPAAWLNAGYSLKTADVTCLFGVAGAYLPRMGGMRSSNGANNPGQGITQGDIYADVTAGAFNFVAEYLVAKVDKGAATASNTVAGFTTTDATVSGFWLQPSVKLGKKWELVARYSLTNTGDRGIRVSDGVRSALAGGGNAAKNLSEYYIGANYYIIGNDLKLQFGYVGGQTSGAITGSTLDKETANGFRTQMQINF